MTASIAKVPQPDLFMGQPLHDAVTFRDDVDLMSMPFFTPEKQSFEPIEFDRTVGEGARARREWLKISPGEFGVATIYDKDPLLYTRTQLIQAINEDRPVGRRIRFHIHDCLRSCNRHVGKADYEAFKMSLTRLKTTTVLTNITVGEDSIDEGFGWIESFKITRRRTASGKEVMAACEMVLSEWLYGLMINHSRAVSIDPEYFKLTGGLERALYGIVRKHVGQQSSWHIGVDKLRLLCGSRRELRKFKYDLAKLCEKGLPGFELELTKDPRPPSLILAGSAPLISRASKDYLVARPIRGLLRPR